jgi:hypothetical protein
MTTLAANKQRVRETMGDEIFNDLPVIATDIIYEGAACSQVTADGTVKPLTTSETIFAGFAERQADNSAGVASAITVRLKQRGCVELTVAAGAGTAADNGVAVYATDDDTFTTSSAGSAVQIGKVFRWKTGTTYIVRFEATMARSV